jgi:hypothetical protein
MTRYHHLMVIIVCVAIVQLHIQAHLVNADTRAKYDHKKKTFRMDTEKTNGYDVLIWMGAAVVIGGGVVVLAPYAIAAGTIASAISSGTAATATITGAVGTMSLSVTTAGAVTVTGATACAGTAAIAGGTVAVVKAL